MTSPDITPETPHFGFTRINQGESFAKNGWAVTDSDRLKLDDLLYAALKHNHDGTPALGDPTDPCTFNPVPSGGHLAAATTYYYRASYVDQWGLETAASPEGNATTPDPIAAPSSPAATVESTSGTLGPGLYSYLLTVTDAYGGETTPSVVNHVQVTDGTTNRVRLDLPTLPTGGVGNTVYRSRPGQSQFYFLGTATSTVFYDDGSAEDQTITAPTVNTTNSANSVEVTVPLGFIPLGCVAWRLYRASLSGGYDGVSLVHQVIEGATDTSPIPRIMWVDTGEVLQAGFPQNVSSAVPQGQLLSLNDLSGTLPLSTTARGARVLSATAAGTLTTRTLTITDSPGDVKPVRLTAYFQTPPDGATTVTARVQDNAATPAHVDLVCTAAPATPVGPAGYFHVSWPLEDALLVYAQDGTLSDIDNVPIITDDLSPSGQSVFLDTNGEYVQTSMGVLEVATYSVFVSARPNSATPVTNDFKVDIIRVDTGVSIGNATFTLSNIVGYHDSVYGTFVAPGGVEIAVRASKCTADTTQSYEVSSMRYTTTVPTLAAGQITVSTIVGSGPTAAADASVSLWF